MKPGIQTTEFWLIVLAVAGALAGVYADKLPGELGALVALVLPAFWAWLRTRAKQTAGTADDVAVDAMRGASEQIRKRKEEERKP